MHFGEPLPDERLEALLRPGDGIDTVITADAYGAGEADLALGRALRGVDRDDYCLIGAVGHDFYEGAREGAKGYPRFTDPRLREPREYAAYLRMATERSLRRCGVEHFDVLMLHNPDRTGYSSDVVWEGMRALRDAGLTRMLGVAPGPANGFTLDLIDCFERQGSLIDWAMIILSPMEPWPGRLVLGAAVEQRVQLITRVVDYGGIFHDDVLPGHPFAEYDHRRFRPGDWVGEGRRRLELMRPYAGRHGLTMLQLACAWNLAQPAVRCVAPTLIQESGAGARPIEDKRAELGALARHGDLVGGLSDGEVREIEAIGENSGCMTLKGGNVEYDGPPIADRWALDEELAAVAQRWEIDPEADLAGSGQPRRATADTTS